MRRFVVLVLAAALAMGGAGPAFAASDDPAPKPANPKTGNTDYDAGRAAIDKGDFAGAITALKRATAARMCCSSFSGEPPSICCSLSSPRR